MTLLASATRLATKRPLLAIAALMVVWGVEVAAGAFLAIVLLSAVLGVP